MGHKARTAPASNNPYLALLCKVYKFLARRTDSDFVQVNELCRVCGCVRDGGCNVCLCACFVLWLCWVMAAA